MDSAAPVAVDGGTFSIGKTESAGVGVDAWPAIDSDVGAAGDVSGVTSAAAVPGSAASCCSSAAGGSFSESGS